VPCVEKQLDHLGRNACNGALCPCALHPHLERRYLIVPVLRSFRIYVFDMQPNPHNPTLIKTIEAEEVMAKTGYSRPHTVYCDPEAIYIGAMGSANGDDGPGGVFMLDHFNFDVIGPWEIDRDDQKLAYDFWWHIAHDVMITSEWAKPHQFEDGVVPEDLLAGRYGHRLHRSPTSTSPWTTPISTSPVGAPAIYRSTTSPIPSTPNSPARSRSAASCARRGIHSTTAGCWMARRWSRSAATAGAST